MWTSRVEIEDYSIANFDRITAFKAPYSWTSVKAGTHTHFIYSLDIHTSMKHVWALPLTEVQRYGAIHNGIIFDFYTGLSFSTSPKLLSVDVKRDNRLSFQTRVVSPAFQLSKVLSILPDISWLYRNQVPRRPCWFWQQHSTPSCCHAWTPWGRQDSYWNKT